MREICNRRFSSRSRAMTSAVLDRLCFWCNEKHCIPSMRKELSGVKTLIEQSCLPRRRSNSGLEVFIPSCLIQLPSLNVGSRAPESLSRQKTAKPAFRVGPLSVRFTLCWAVKRSLCSGRWAPIKRQGDRSTEDTPCMWVKLDLFYENSFLLFQIFFVLGSVYFLENHFERCSQWLRCRL